MNSRGTLAPESRIAAQLKTLGVSHRDFAAISGVKYGNLSNILAGNQELEDEEAERLLDLIQRMYALETEVGLPLDWSRPEVGNAVVLRQVGAISEELRLEDRSFAEAAAHATQRVKQSAARNQ